MKQTIYILFLTLGASTLLLGQPPIPAPAQDGPIAIVGGTAHLGNGEVIENALITFEDGKITRVDQATAKVDISDHRQVNAEGKHIYPGFIAPNTTLGIVEISAVRATRDIAEVGSLNPNARSIIAYNTDSHVTPTVRARGVLYAQIVPEGGRLSGQSSVVQLDAWNWEDAAVKTDDGHHLRWPRRRTYNWRQGKWSANKNYGKDVEAVEDFLLQAKAYCEADNTKRNLRLASACGLFNGEQKLFVHANLAPDIQQAVLIAKTFGVDMVLVGGAESYLIADMLAEYEVPVIYGPTHDLPNTLDSDVDQTFKTPAALHEAGVEFCLSNEGFWQQRNLPFQAGSAVGYGLAYEAAVEALTLSTARILGIDELVGSLEEGKHASLIITSGDALDMRTNQVEHAFISGREISLDNKQDQLYRRFKTKYERQE